MKGSCELIGEWTEEHTQRWLAVATQIAKRVAEEDANRRAINKQEEVAQ